VSDELAVTTPTEKNTPDLWKIGDSVALLVYTATVLWTIQYHEKWADEAQAWLIARDLSLKSIWFHELRYEGTPGLWHTILWIVQRVFCANYDSISYIGAFFAIAGAALLLFKAPFPRIVRWPMAFGYVFLYQYAVIARPYTMLALLAFGSAILFNDLQHPERITVVLVLLTLVSLHGAILAGCLGLAYLLEAARCRSTLNRGVRRRYAIGAGALVLSFVFLVVILKPTPDVQEFATPTGVSQQVALMRANAVTVRMKLESVLSGAFLDFTVPSVLFTFLLGAYCALRRRLLIYVLPVAALVALYVVVHGYAHHQGTVTIAAIMSLWIAWPSDTEKATLSTIERRATQGVIAVLLVFCAVQIWDSAVVIRHEYLYPYSGAGDAATFLKSEGADQTRMFGYSYGIAGVQAYFERNIFANLPTTYFHHGLPLYGRNFDLAEVDRQSPAYVVIFDEDPQRIIDLRVIDGLASIGYQMVHFSDGYQLYRRGVYVRQVYFILKRTGWQSAYPSKSQGPPSSNASNPN
jgi:hypothetical protein